MSVLSATIETIISSGSYNNFNYHITHLYDESFECYFAYIDVTKYPFLGNPNTLDKIPFRENKKNTLDFASTFDELFHNDNYFIGGSYSKDKCIFTNEVPCNIIEDIKFAIDSFPQFIMKYTLEYGDN